MLRVDIRDLRRGPVETAELLDGADPVLADLGVGLVGPVQVTGVMQGVPERRTVSWRGRLRATVRGECRRCLADVDTPLDLSVDAVFSADPDAADDPGVYAWPDPLTAVDLAPMVREELLLAAPAFVLCREDCAGLCPRCGADLNLGACDCQAAPASS